MLFSKPRRATGDGKRAACNSSRLPLGFFFFNEFFFDVLILNYDFFFGSLTTKTSENNLIKAEILTAWSMSGLVLG